MLKHGQIAALGITVVTVDIAAEDHAALIGLTDVKMPGAKGDDDIQQRFQGLGHHRL